MVNLKKIGAIATGALFVGATFGMAAAATFNSGMLVSGGVAKAKIVTPTANPDPTGNQADAASGAIVNNAVKGKFSTTSGGANIQFKYDAQDIDDDSDSVTTVADDGDFNKTARTDLTIDKWMEGDLNLTSWMLDLASATGDNTKVATEAGGDKGGIRFDATGDGDVSDSDDQAIYNDILIEDVSVKDITITPAMRIGNASTMAGAHTVFKLKGQKYITKKYESSKSQVTLGPVSEMKISNADTTQDMMDAAVLIPGTDTKIGLKGLKDDGTKVEATFGIIESGVVKEYKVRNNVSSGADGTLVPGGDDMELLSDFEIFVSSIQTGTSNDFVEISVMKKTDEFKVSDGDTDVLGYSKAKVKQDADGSEFRLEDPSMVINKDSEAQIGNTNVYAKYNDDKEFDLIAKKVKTATSGSKLKESQSPWSDFLKMDVTASVVGNNVQFKYDDQDIDDDSDSVTTVADDGDFNKTARTDLTIDKWMEGDLNLTSWMLDLASATGDNTKVATEAGGDKGGIRFDATGDGDVSDSDDQAIYNDILIEDVSVKDITIKPAMRIGNASTMAGAHTVFKLKGQKYITKKYESSKSQVTLGPVSEMKISNADTTQDMMDAAVLIPGTDTKIGLKGLNDTGAKIEATFGIIESGVVKEYKVRNNVSSGADGTLVPGGDDMELLSDFEIFVSSIQTGTSNDFVEISVMKKTDEFKVSDGDTDVLGYSKAKVKQDADGSEFRLEDPSMVINKDSEAQIGNTNVYAKYNDDKEFDLIAKKVKTATSGSKLKKTQSPWSDFLTIDVTATATGGQSQAVSLATVKDTDVTSGDKSGYNLVLMGGHKANILTADLVTSGKSKVNWENSNGEVEVVENAFATGKYGIIVAGKNRAATATAANALAAMV